MSVKSDNMGNTDDMQSVTPAEFSIGLDVIVKEFDIEVFYSPSKVSEINIENNDINRPGLQFAGFYEYFDNTRIQIVGKMEISYLAHCDAEEKTKLYDNLIKTKPPAIILAREIKPDEELLKVAQKHCVPILGTQESTSVIASKIIAFLNLKLAPRITRHGAFVEVYGEGMLIIGGSGAGKSETAIELIKRGHRLIADDAVEIRKTSNITLVGSSPDNIRHFLELRGIGIINVRQLFGVGAVKLSEKINMVVELEAWDDKKQYDRMGIDTHFMSILGVKVPYLLVPVKPGRNLAVILETAAMNNRQKKMGVNAAQDLLSQLGLNSQGVETVTDWS
ncbi:MAG: HPr(Ser) kinase/phosphatase [Oscillospiraceae bacterium]|nr:HPr(Ser) kinase/phosphatase [Oscillospiraceae bacterium]